MQDYDIWRLREGEAPAPLIASSMIDMNPEYSPDGRQIAFASDRAGESFDIWVANADGSEPVQLTHENGLAGSPRWSPDGRFIVFDLHTPEGEVDLYRVNVADGRSQRLTWDPGAENLPTFSPDGKWIYFRSDRSGTRQLWRRLVDGGEALQITRNGADTGLVSTDGKTLYYTRSDGLFAIPVTSGAERLVDDSVLPRCFAVTANQIYYVSKPRSDNRHVLRILDLSTSRARVLRVLDGPIVQGLTVSTDRKTILYTRQKDLQCDLMLIENFR
jgi:Tol biopolymer transport system component